MHFEFQACFNFLKNMDWEFCRMEDNISDRSKVNTHLITTENVRCVNGHTGVLFWGAVGYVLSVY